MHKFVRNLLTEWRKLKLPFENETILVAVSGGADSVALMLALHDLRESKKLRLNFIVAHFNHKLRGAESDADETFVKNLAKQLEIKFVSQNRKPEAKNRKPETNLEQSARRARYDFLERNAKKLNAKIVLTAHTANDQAETVLLNLVRGSGIDGLGAMRKIRPLEKLTKRKLTPETENEEANEEKFSFSDSLNRSDYTAVLLVRPLLSWAKREDTESFALEKKIDFRHDSMNDDENFSRVRLRKKIIPLFQEMNPKIVETLAQTAFLLQKDAQELSNNTSSAKENPAIKDLQLLSKSTLYGVLREWLKSLRGDLRGVEMNRIEAIEQLIFSRKSGRRVELPNSEAVIKKDGKLFFEKTKVEKSRCAN